MEFALLVAALLNFAILLVILLRRPATDVASELAKQNAALQEALLKGLLQVQEKVQQDLQRGRQEQFETMRKGLAEVGEKLVKIHEATGTVVELSKGINALNTVLTKSQGRGAFGEWALERMLADLFGDHTELYAIQHVLDGGERVDAAIFVRPDRSQLLAVDSKFPLANAMPILEGRGSPEDERAFAKDVRERAKEIATRYIRPPQTLDFAFMFVPSEAIYYLVLKDAKLHQDLIARRVIPTSPNAFYAYLQALAMAFRGMKMEQKAAEIQKTIAQIAKDFTRFYGDWIKVGGKLKEAVGAYDASVEDGQKFTQRIEKLKLGDAAESVPSLPVRND